MKGRALAKMGVLLIVTFGAWVPMEAKAFPFETTPEGFKNFLNSIENWEDGYGYEVINPRNCSFNEFYSNEGWEIYQCRIDYKQFSSLGVRTCVNTFSEYWKSDTRRNADGDVRADRKHIRAILDPQCGDWEKVSTTPEPQSQATPQDTPQQKRTTSPSTCVDNNLILAGGAGIFVVGGLLGVAFSQLLGRKKD